MLVIYPFDFMNKIFDFIFDEVVFVPINLHEIFVKDEPYEGGALAINNRYDVIQLLFFMNFVFIVCVPFFIYARIHRFYMLESSPSTLLGLLVCGVGYVISRIMIKHLRNRKYVQNLMKEYFSFSEDYKRRKCVVWYVKLFFVFTLPLIIMSLMSFAEDSIDYLFPVV